MKRSFLTMVAVTISILFIVQSQAFNLGNFLDKLDEKTKEGQRIKDTIDQTQEIIEGPTGAASGQIDNGIGDVSTQGIGDTGDDAKGGLLGVGESFGLIDKKTANIARQSLNTYKALQPMKYEEEKTIGSTLAVEVFNRFEGAYDDPNLIKYVNLVGQAVARVSDRPDIDYYFAIVNSKAPNAFATPGGYVFVSIGLLWMIQNEAQLAGVLGHEIAHITHKHALGTIQRSKQLQGIGALTMLVMEKDPALFSQLIDQVSDLLFTNGLDKNLEFEADRMGIEYAVRAGYYPTGLKDFLKILGNSQELQRSTILRTHPSARQRYRLLVKQLTKYEDSRSNPLLADRFKRMTENLL
jgi:beta-barrel assembly-enhancing protease